MMQEPLIALKRHFAVHRDFSAALSPSRSLDDFKKTNFPMICYYKICDVVEDELGCGCLTRKGTKMILGPVETVAEDDSVTTVLHEKENGKLDQEPGLWETIKFGSLGDEPIEVEGNDVSDVNFPKDAVDECAAPKQIHLFDFCLRLIKRTIGKIKSDFRSLKH
nr:hypothetical protein CFP56_50219 [Quercus suber]